MEESLVPDIDWVVYTDEDQQLDYYYNRVSGDTQWDIPPEFAAWKHEVAKNYLKSINSNWRAGECDGKYFYYNKVTKKSEFTTPKELSEYIAALTQKRRDEFDAQQQVEEAEKDESFVEPELPPEEITVEEEAAYYDDDAKDAQDGTDSFPYQPYTSDRKREIETQIGEQSVELSEEEMIKFLEAKLLLRDSIMDANVLETVDKYMKLSETSPDDIVKMLCGTYSGYAKMSQIICDWLDDAAKYDSVNSKLDTKPVISTLNSVESTNDRCIADDVVYDLISNLIKQKFDKKKADSLIQTGSEVPRFLSEMIGIPMWRKLLIELLDSNKGSALLGYCLRNISSLGYHREISQIIKESDYFVVFSDLIQDFITNIHILDENEIRNRCDDLCRMCSNGDYLFLYAQVFLDHVESSLKGHILSSEQQISGNKRGVESLYCCENSESGSSVHNALAYRSLAGAMRVRQELERSVIWEGLYGILQGVGSRSSSKGGGAMNNNSEILLTTANAKLDGRSSFSLRMTSHFGPMTQSLTGINREIWDILKDGVIEDFHIRKLAQSLLGIGDRIESFSLGISEIDKFKSIPVSTIKCLGHYQIITYFLDGIMHPTRGLQVAGSIRRCAAILAIVIYFLTSDGVINSDETTLNSISSMIDDFIAMKASCSELISMEYSGILIYEKGEFLLRLLKLSSINSICFLRWLYFMVFEGSKLTTSSFAAVSPIFLQCIVCCIDRYPAQHAECYVILQTMYEQKTKVEDAETGRAIELTSLKCDIVECLVFLIGKGYTNVPLDFFLSEVDTADAAIVRHMTIMLLESLKSPFNQKLVVKLVSFICSVGTKRALMSKHFGERGCSALAEFLDSIVLMPLIEKNKISELKSLLAACQSV